MRSMASRRMARIAASARGHPSRRRLRRLLRMRFGGCAHSSGWGLSDEGAMSTMGNIASRGFWHRTYAMLVKEFIQLRRDRVSFGMIVMLPLMQLILFGYAINTTPRNLPTAVLLQESSDVGRSILAALQNTQYFRVTHQ